MKHNEISRGSLMMSIGFLMGLFSSVLAIYYPNIRYIGLGVLLSFVIVLIGQVLFFRDLKKYKE
jgi:hypothetical protein